MAAECAKQNIYVHLDNHMSTGTWCCSNTDGNGFWGDEYFPVTNWTRGLSYMASHVRRRPPVPICAQPPPHRDYYYYYNYYYFTPS